MNWKLLASVLTAGVVLGVSFIVWPPAGPSLEHEIQQRGGKVHLGHDETVLLGVMLEGPQFGDADAEKLARLSTIRKVSFEKSSITREAVRHLLPLSELRSLNLSHTQLDPEALDDVARFTALQQLHLAGCLWFRDDDLRRLEPLQQLEELILSETEISAVGVEHLRQLPSLRVLSLNGCRMIHDDAVELLSQLSKMKALDLTSCEISSRAAIQLRQALPNTRLRLTVSSFSDLRRLSSKLLFGCGHPPREDTIGWLLLTGASDFSESRSVEQNVRIVTSTGVGTGTEKTLLSPGDLASLAHLTDIESITLEASHVTDEMLLELGTRPALKTLSLHGTQVTDEGLKALSGFPNLSYLNLRGTHITELGVSCLLGLSQLQYLQIQVAHESALMDVLPKLPHLEHLHVYAPLTDTGFVRLPALPQLTLLAIYASRLRQLPPLPQLKRLYVHVEAGSEWIEPLSQLPLLAAVEVHAPLTDAELLRLPALPELASLEIHGARIVGSGLAALVRAPKLASVSFSDVPLQDEPCLEALAQLKALRFIALQRTGVTRAGCERLRKNRPDMEVRWCDPNTSEWVTLE